MGRYGNHQFKQGQSDRGNCWRKLAEEYESLDLVGTGTTLNERGKRKI